MQEYLHPSRALLDGDLLRCIAEPETLHGFQEDRGFVTAGVGEDHLLAAGREQPRYEASEGGGVLSLVEHVRGEDHVEGPDTSYVWFAPVECGDLRFQFQVGAGVVGRKVEGGLVVVCGEYPCPAGECDDGRQPDAAPELDGTGAGKVAFREVAGQGEGARP